jgi:hypothetical protein
VRTFKFDPKDDIPIVVAKIYGPRKTKKIRLVFDTGCAITQVHTGIIEDIGYSVADAESIANILGPVGDSQSGYVLEVDNVSVFGMSLPKHKVGAFDFYNFDKDDIDGLLGFDVIKLLHLEMNGPKGELNLF